MLFYGISTLLIQLAFVSCTQALAVLLPLYVYPGTNCAAWSSVFSAISAHMSTTFYIIVNPNSGPGSGGSQPDSNFVACVPQLRPSGSQTVLLGYVDVNSPTSGSVESDIDTYAGWDTAYRPTGIYLDDVSPTANLASTYQGYLSHATSKGFTFTALDPGEAAPSSYLDMADLVNTYEDAYSSFNPSSLSGTLSKQSVILVNAPSTGSYSAVISQLESLGVEAVYISDVSDSVSDLPVQLSEFVSEVAGAGGSSTSSGSSSSGSSSSGSTSGSSSSSGTTSGGSTSSGSASSGNASSGSSSGSNPPSNPSNPKSSGSASSAPSSKAGSSPSSSGSPSSPSKGASTQSTALKGSLATSSAKPQGSNSSSSPPSGGTSPNQPTSATHTGPPIAAIVGGVLGGLVLVLLALLALLLCRRRRGRRPGVAAAEGVAPFTVEYITNASASSEPSTWNDDVKAPLPEASASTDAEATVPMATSADVHSTRASYPSTARLSAAPAYGSRRGSTGPPPSYSADE